jgi:hypothetical protein
MRPREINRLLSQKTNGFCVAGGERVVRQVRMEVEGRNVLQPVAGVEVAHSIERLNLICGALHDGRAKPVRFSTGTPRPFITERVYLPKRCCRGTRGSP